MRRLVAVAAALLLAAIPATASAADTTLQRDTDALVRAGNVGAIVEVTAGRTSATARAGVAVYGTTTPVPAGAHYRTGSITKTLVAATVLQLVGEGRVGLDDPIDRYLPGLINRNGNDGTKITVRHLLQHTSGLFSYDGDERFAATILDPATFYANRYRHYEPIDLINLALDHPPNFAPGTRMDYSNTGYIVAGELIRAVTGNNWRTEVSARILQPLGMRESSFPADNPLLPEPFAHGYAIWTSNQQNRVYSDTTEHNMSWGGSAGEMITTTSDISRFFSALLGGRVLKPAQLTAMKTTVPFTSSSSYGLGLARTKMACAPGKEVWWHSGGVVGYSTWAGTTPDTSRTLGMSLSTVSFFDASVAAASSAAQDALFRHMFCGDTTTDTTSLTAEDEALHGGREAIR